MPGLEIQQTLEERDGAIKEFREKELDLRKKKQDKIAFHSLYREPESGEIAFHTADTYLGIHPNAIAEAFTDLYDREVKRSLGGLGE